MKRAKAQNDERHNKTKLISIHLLLLLGDAHHDVEPSTSVIHELSRSNLWNEKTEKLDRDFIRKLSCNDDQSER